MKSTGIVRKLDSFGRVVLPMEIRRNMELEEGTPIELFVEGDDIILRKNNPSCVFCGNVEGLKSFEGKLICQDCAKRIAKLGVSES